MGFECYTLYLLHIQHGGEGEQGDRIKGSRVEVMLREYKLVLQEFCFSFFFFFSFLRRFWIKYTRDTFVRGFSVFIGIIQQ